MPDFDIPTIISRFRSTPSWQIVFAWTGVAVLLAIAVIVLAAISSSQAEGVLSGVADLVKAFAWPAAVVFVIAAFREPISRQLGRVTRVNVPGGSIELEREIDQQLEQAKTDADQLDEPSRADFDRARAVRNVATLDDLPEIRRRMLDLASQYRRIRGASDGGDDRTRAQSVLVAQMRALGQAAYPLRGEFAFSDDPGRRLAALAIAQVQPDPTMLTWVATRIGPSERPFAQYQALQALLVAARNGDASQAVLLDQAYRIALKGYNDLTSDERTEAGDRLFNSLNSQISPLRHAYPVKPAT
jgi:hypothetical protein